MMSPIDAAAQGFSGGPRHLSAVEDPSPGVYAVALVSSDDVGETLLAKATEPIIYVGKSKRPLKRRLAGDHATAGRTGSSTLRSTLGAILRERLCLVPIPRGRDNSSHYRFEEDGENRLSDWIERNLVAIWLPLEPGMIRAKELDFIRNIKPMLNLQDCRTRWTDRVQALRDACKKLAEEHR